MKSSWPEHCGLWAVPHIPGQIDAKYEDKANLQRAGHIQLWSELDCMNKGIFSNRESRHGEFNLRWVPNYSSGTENNMCNKFGEPLFIIPGKGLDSAVVMKSSCA